MVLYVVSSSSADGRMVSRPSQETATAPPPLSPPLIFLQHRLHNMHSRGELGVSWMRSVSF